MKCQIEEQMSEDNKSTVQPILSSYSKQDGLELMALNVEDGITRRREVIERAARACLCLRHSQSWTE